MDFSSLIIVLPIFFLAYQGVGLFLDSRTQKWDGLDLPPAERKATSGKAVREFTSWGSKLGFNQILLRYQKLNDRLSLLLLRSGHPFGWKAEDLLFVKELTALLVLFLVWRAAGVQPVGFMIALVLGFMLPDFYIQAKVSERQTAIQRNLPGFVDLISLTLESGLDFMTAIEKILEKMKPGSLREELSLLIQEERLGTPRKESLEHLAHRVNLPDLHSLTSLMIQSEEFGTGLATVLRAYSEDMRSKRILRAEEAGSKAPVRLLFPMMIFFFPIIFVIIFGPLALNFISSYK